ncbi:MAG: prepilin-type N-terminal cleavage/methylation domain-containing protein, partial [candidate division Zixibacteria bacterium]|nr:prepilin-type N-terminal cleavage/methylation domain-containing protein [candidate division Zixibacteria bacterium]
MFGSLKDRTLSVLRVLARQAGGRRSKSKRGFTLVELVIIIVILGIVAGVAIPKMSDLSRSAKITATK